MSDDLVRRFRLLQEALNHGCSDGGCVIEVTKGQHTNGGCKCLYHPEQYTLNRVGHMLRCAQDMADHIEELEARLAKAVDALEHAKLNMPHPDQMIDDTLAELKADQ